jgi:hypothetical protein
MGANPVLILLRAGTQNVGTVQSELFDDMIAAQPLACHSASRECYRRAMIVESLNRHRGKGQQRVTVEHVTRGSANHKCGTGCSRAAITRTFFDLGQKRPAGER